MQTLSNLFKPPHVDWLSEGDLEALDNASIAADNSRRALEKAVSFADLLEECCEFTGPQRETFMRAVDRDDAWTLLALIDQARQRIVERRVRGGV